MTADQEDKMTAWLLWMLVACLSDGGVTGCSVRSMIVASKLSNVSISCPSVIASSQGFKYLLSLNDSCISIIEVKKQLDSAGSLFSGQFEVTVSNNGVYVCKREVIYPPPFREDCHSTEVKVEEKQSFQTINGTAPPANQSCPDRSPFIPEVVMWAVCGVLLVYSFSITCTTIIILRKLKRHEEDTSVYMNTRKPYKA